MYRKDIFGPPEKRPCEVCDLHADLVWLMWLVDCLFNAELTALLSLQKLWFVDVVIVILPLTINEALKWLSSVPILMLQSCWWWRYCASLVKVTPPPTHPHTHPPDPHLLGSRPQPVPLQGQLGVKPVQPTSLTNIIGGSHHKYHFCHDKSFVATKLCLSWQEFCNKEKYFVATNTWQAYFCRDKRRVLSWQTHVGRDKTYDKNDTSGSSHQWYTKGRV